MLMFLYEAGFLIPTTNFRTVLSVLPRRIDDEQEENAMNERRFQLRMSCRYEDPDNSIVDLEAEVLVKRRWEALDPGLRTPGFLLFAYTILTCQHTYFRTNCTERGFRLAEANGSIDLLTGEDWILRKLHVRFDALLKSGAPTRQDVDYIAGRMRQCPVSKNLVEVPDIRTRVRFG